MFNNTASMNGDNTVIKSKVKTVQSLVYAIEVYGPAQISGREHRGWSELAVS